MSAILLPAIHQRNPKTPRCPQTPGCFCERKRRALLAHMHTDDGVAIPVDWSYQRLRMPQHQPALTVDEVMKIRTVYADWSLRELMGRFGVSHETIRKARNATGSR